jgi:hypothetical protein
LDYQKLWPKYRHGHFESRKGFWKVITLIHFKIHVHQSNLYRVKQVCLSVRLYVTSLRLLHWFVKHVCTESCGARITLMRYVTSKRTHF